MKIEVWSDIACPFCYIGKRHLEAALADFEHAGDVEVVWKSFELQPDAERNADVVLDAVDDLAGRKALDRERVSAMMLDVTEMASAVGLEYHLDRTVPTNSFDAHRLIHLAATHGLQAEAEERFFKAYFVENKHLGRHDVLTELMKEIGLQEDEVRETLESDAFGYEVRSDEQEARSLGITGVPFFVIDRTYGISGARPIGHFKEVLSNVWEELHTGKQ